MNLAQTRELKSAEAKSRPKNQWLGHLVANKHVSGKAMDCSTNTSVIHSFIHSSTDSVLLFLQIFLGCCNTLAVGVGAFKIDHPRIVLGIVNIKGIQIKLWSKSSGNFAEYLNFSPIGGVASGRVCTCSLRSSLVFSKFYQLCYSESNIRNRKSCSSSCSC